MSGLGIVLLLQSAAALDTLPVRAAPPAAVFDGAVGSAEWGVPDLSISAPGGGARIWLRGDSTAVYVAARISDSTSHWGDDLVVSVHVGGPAGSAPGHDDFQWDLRRLLDSSVVYRGKDGRWHPPRDDPDWRLGPAREGAGWEVRSESGTDGWSLELRLDRAYLAGREGGPARIAFRIFDNAPRGWHAWPGRWRRQPTEVEDRPELWAVVTD
ncbi:MAG TPA: hypothetical protein VNJ71_11380 [Gemmatimonadales bacterium]|nr:hypothetical protein [Gemmatimonadales bacterium]